MSWNHFRWLTVNTHRALCLKNDTSGLACRFWRPAPISSHICPAHAGTLQCASSLHLLSKHNMPRFYIPQPLTPGTAVDLPIEVAHHLNVVRFPTGATLTLFNGEGDQYAATVTAISKRHATVNIDALELRDVEAPYAITLAQALPEGTKMDWVVEKAVELGAAAIQPLAAQRGTPVRRAGRKTSGALAGRDYFCVRTVRAQSTGAAACTERIQALADDPFGHAAHSADTARYGFAGGLGARPSSTGSDDHDRAGGRVLAGRRRCSAGSRCDCPVDGPACTAH